MATDNEYVSKELYDRVTEELEATKQALSEEMERAETAETRVKELDPLEGKYTEAQKSLKSLQAARAFEKMADEMGVKPEFRDAVFELSKYDPGDGDFDEKALRDHVSKYLDGNKHFTKTADEGKTTLTKGEGSTRGGRSPAMSDSDVKKQVTQDQLNDPDWTTANAETLKSMNYEIVSH